MSAAAVGWLAWAIAALLAVVYYIHATRRDRKIAETSARVAQAFDDAHRHAQTLAERFDAMAEVAKTLKPDYDQAVRDKLSPPKPAPSAPMDVCKRSRSRHTLK